jgi:hypothetical protein
LELWIFVSFDGSAAVWCSCAPTSPDQEPADPVARDVASEADVGIAQEEVKEPEPDTGPPEEEVWVPWHCEADTDCEDKNPCTENLCAPSGDCLYPPMAGICDDGNPCTLSDSCTGGVCTGSFKFCDDGNYCSDDFCDPKTGQCQHLDNESDCEDGNGCTLDDYYHLGDCQGGLGKTCSDSNHCTSDSCDPATGACSHELLEDGQVRDNGNPCTLGDTCLSGLCEAGSPVDCDDANSCTSEECLSDKGGCTYTNLEVHCEDGDLCTADDQCVNGQCQGGTAVTCADENICTDDVCDPFTGGAAL